MSSSWVVSTFPHRHFREIVHRFTNLSSYLCHPLSPKCWYSSVQKALFLLFYTFWPIVITFLINILILALFEIFTHNRQNLKTHQIFCKSLLFTFFQFSMSYCFQPSNGLRALELPENSISNLFLTWANIDRTCCLRSGLSSKSVCTALIRGSFWNFWKQRCFYGSFSGLTTRSIILRKHLIDHSWILSNLTEFLNMSPSINSQFVMVIRYVWR